MDLAEENRQSKSDKITIGSKLELPKGGGAVKGLEENLSVNQSTGTLNMSLKLPFLENRHSFNPSLSLNYSSASGNGILGVGWELSLPAIFRKTDKRIPQYRDDDDIAERDPFVLSGFDDLVPAMEQDKDGNWGEMEYSSGNLKIKRYRPRIEKDFLKIEQIRVDSGMYWKVTSGNNQVTFYGLSEEGRIFDPQDNNKVWKWLPQVSYDNLGNIIEYKYKREDRVNIPGKASEQTRSGDQANCYLKRVLYGNNTPFFNFKTGIVPADIPADMNYFFEVVMDYGEQGDLDPYYEKADGWPSRIDSFSTCKPGFEVRTSRLLQRVLFFNRFTELSNGDEIEPVLVNSVDISYRNFGRANFCEVDFISSITQSFYKKTTDGSYIKRSLPSLTFDFTEADLDIKKVKSGQLLLDETAPGENYFLIDYLNEGIPGLLFEKPEGLYYSANLGEGVFQPAEKVVSIPSSRGLNEGRFEIGALDPGGRKFLISMDKESPGFYELDTEGLAIGFTPFKEIPTIDRSHKNGCYIDLNGDGLGELAFFDDGKLIFYPNKGRSGFGEGILAALPVEVEGDPKLIWSAGHTGMFLADMNGDGMTDIVLIRNGDVSYWPNMGYGNFGLRIQMDGSPFFDAGDAFDPERVRLPDLTGTGAADLVYCGTDSLKVYLNSCGNSFSEGFDSGFHIDGSTIKRWGCSDLFGSGFQVLHCRAVSRGGEDGFYYVDLLGRKKPYLLKTVDNGCGRKSTVGYRSSSSYYLEDKKLNKKWVSRLPFPALCVESITLNEMTSGFTSTNRYRYRHGFYNGYEKEFMGFGLVEVVNTEVFGKAATVRPDLTRTWYHIGTNEEWPEYLAHFQSEFYHSDNFNENFDYGIGFLNKGHSLGDKGLKEAFRALKFAALRSETYGLDGTVKEGIPYETTAVRHLVKEVQPGCCPSFMRLEESVAHYSYERNESNPRITEIQNVLFEDETGMVLESAVSSYGNPPEDGLPDSAVSLQQEKHILYTVYQYTEKIDAVDYRLPQMAEKSSYELIGTLPNGSLSCSQLKSLFAASSKKVGTERILYYSDDLQSPLAFGKQGIKGAVFRKLSLVFDNDLVHATYNGEIGTAELETLGYISSTRLISDGLFKGGDDGGWWTGSEQLLYSAVPEADFCLPVGSKDFCGKTEILEYYKDYHLLLSALEDPMGFRTEVSNFDLRLLSPAVLIDRNQNISEVCYDVLGEVTARALKGKGSEGDNLLGIEADLSQEKITAFFNDPLSHAAELLGEATERTICDYSSIPLKTAKLSTEIHKAMQKPGQENRIFIDINFFDGFGNVISSKRLYEPGEAREIDPEGNIVLVDTGTANRWMAGGRVVFNHKGLRYIVYEPYFSTNQHFDAEEALYKTGAYTTYLYDSLGRNCKTIFPEGTFERIEIDSWQVSLYDRNDNVEESGWYAERQTGALAADPYEKAAADQTLICSDTPSIQFLESRGKPVLIRTQVKTPAKPELGLEESTETSDTVIKYDIWGNRREAVSPRGFVQEEIAYDMIGQAIMNRTADTGTRKFLYNALQMVSMTWDERDYRTRFNYDDLNRVTLLSVLEPGGTDWQEAERTEYGETLPGALLKNQLGQAVRHYDRSGGIYNEEFDFKGNVLRFTRSVVRDFEENPDWSLPSGPLPEQFTFERSYNALNIPIAEILPDGSVQATEVDLGGYLKKISADVKGSGLKELVSRIKYNEKGRRILIGNGNGVQTFYEYDPLTFRLVNLTSIRKDGASSKLLQKIIYTYDPVGNITCIRDLAGETVFFDGGSASPENRYLYDSVYRLVRAEGREHEGQNKAGDAYDYFRSFANHPNDGSAMRRYREHYLYDLDGNMKELRHYGGSTPSSWTRTMEFQPVNNHLIKETTGSLQGDYDYDQAGNINKMPHLQDMKWDYKGMMVYSENSPQQYTRYFYDSSGQRIRKVTRYPNGTVKERIYLGLMEIFREYSGSDKTSERNTLCFHDQDKVFLEIDVDALEPAAANALYRFRLDNHQSANMMELDGQGRVISYEEYYPFGGTSFKATRSWGVEAPMSRYRYLGKERDEESGLYYFGLRYYAPWIGKWISPDPEAPEESRGLYVFLNNNPARFNDPSGGRDEDEVDGNTESSDKDTDKSGQKGRDQQKDKKDQKERPTVLGVILSSLQLLKGATLMVLGIINGDNWLKILKKVAGVVKDIWDYLGYLSEKVADWQKNAIDTVVNFGKKVGNAVWTAIKDFFKWLWRGIVKLFTGGEENKTPEKEAGKPDKPGKETEAKKDNGIDIDFDVSVDSSGLNLTLKIGKSELTLAVGDGLAFKGNIQGYKFEVGTDFKFSGLKYEYGGKFGSSKGEIKFSLDQYERKNSAIFKTAFFWLNFYRNRAVYQASSYY